MQNKLKKIIKITVLLVILTLITIICVLTISFNNANHEEINTPVIITPAKKEVMPDRSIPTEPKIKPITRDENNMPKSDYKVPEIG